MKTLSFLLSKIARFPRIRAAWNSVPLSELLLVWAVDRNDAQSVDEQLACRGHVPLSKDFAYICLSNAMRSLEASPNNPASMRILRALLATGARLKDAVHYMVASPKLGNYDAVQALLDTHELTQNQASSLFCFLANRPHGPVPESILLHLLEHYPVDVYAPTSLRNLILNDWQHPMDVDMVPLGSGLEHGTDRVVEKLLDQASRLPSGQDCWRLLSREEPLSDELLYRLEKGGVAWPDLLLGIATSSKLSPAERAYMFPRVVPKLAEQIERASAWGRASDRADELDAETFKQNAQPVSRRL